MTDDAELAHVMLKPDTLKSGLRDVVLRELVECAGPPVASLKLTLSLYQIEAVYPKFPNLRAKPFIFKYFTTEQTEHFAFHGKPGLHQRLHETKGRTGSGKGIRGKYYTRYTRLSPSELDQWLQGTLASEAEIDLEMFGRDILHVADNPVDSLRGLNAVIGIERISRFTVSRRKS
jgi:hypothetical protein